MNCFDGSGGNACITSAPSFSVATSWLAMGRRVKYSPASSVGSIPVLTLWNDFPPGPVSSPSPSTAKNRVAMIDAPSAARRIVNLLCTFVSLQRPRRWKAPGQAIARDDEAEDSAEDGKQRVPDDRRAQAA